MQGQENSVEHFAGVFGLEMGSSSGNPVMDQQVYWNNVIGSAESHNLRDYQMNYGDATIPHGSDAQQDGAFLGFWESGEASSSGSALNYGRSNNDKTEHLNIGRDLRIGERPLVAENNLSVDVDINVSSNSNDQYGQSSNANRASQGPDNYGVCDHNGTNAQPSDLRLYPYRAFLYSAGQADPFSSLNPSENPLDDLSLMSEGIDPRPGSSIEGRRLACKRKNIEGATGKSSTNVSTSVSDRNNFSFQNIASSSNNVAPVRNSSPQNCLLVSSSIEDQLPLHGTNAGPSSSSYDFIEGTNVQRSFRPRTTTVQQIAPCSVWPSSNTFSFSNSWNIHPPYLQSTFDEPQEVIPVVSTLNLQAANHFTGHRVSSSRSGSLDNRILSREEVTRRNVVPTSFSDLLPAASVEMRRSVPEPSNWSSDSRGTAVSESAPSVSRTNINSTANPPAGFTQQNLNRRHFRNLSEIGRLSGALRAHQAARLRSGYLLERGNEGVQGVPLPIRSREGRRLMEIRNALQMMQRGEVRLESIFYGGIDIHDRHSDMRLDIDNMSYEELLALGERIGNVSTGLSEETVAKLLKQRKFSSWRLEASSDHEPCCICQEEYVDGDDLGRLDCGHDFHAGCIKQWLVLKNLCPICKSTALKT